MSGYKKYLLDANVFIEASQRYYGFDLCPGFWECLAWHHDKGRVRSVDRVKEELEAGKDELAKWVTSAALATCFIPTNDGGRIRVSRR